MMCIIVNASLGRGKGVFELIGLLRYVVKAQNEMEGFWLHAAMDSAK